MIHAPIAPHQSVRATPAEGWLLQFYDSLTTERPGKKPALADYRDAYLCGQRFRQHLQEPYGLVEPQVAELWDDLIGPSQLSWDEARPVIEYAYTHAHEQGCPC